MKDKNSTRMKGIWLDKSAFGIWTFCLLLLAVAAFAATFDEAKNAVDLAEKNVDEMFQAGFTTIQTGYTLNKTKAFFSSGDYGSALTLAKQINAAKEKAFYVHDLFGKLDENIILLSKLTDITEIKEKLHLASTEFYKENYARAEELANQVSADIENKKSELSLELVSKPESGFVKFVEDNWHIFLVAIALISVYYAIFRERIKIQNKRHRLQQLDGIDKNTRNAIEKTQEDYFLNKKLDSYEYHIKMNTFRRHLSAIKSERLVIQRELKKAEIKRMLEALEAKLLRLRNKGAKVGNRFKK